jgi:hypothetical protein
MNVSGFCGAAMPACCEYIVLILAGRALREHLVCPAVQEGVAMGVRSTTKGDEMCVGRLLRRKKF